MFYEPIASVRYPENRRPDTKSSRSFAYRAANSREPESPYEEQLVPVIPEGKPPTSRRPGRRPDALTRITSNPIRIAANHQPSFSLKTRPKTCEKNPVTFSESLQMKSMDLYANPK